MYEGAGSCLVYNDKKPPKNQQQQMCKTTKCSSKEDWMDE